MKIKSKDFWAKPGEAVKLEEWPTSVQPRNGPKKPAMPTASDSRHLVLKIAGSSSAPARKVRTMAPAPAR